MQVFQMISPNLSIGEWWIGESIDACKQKMQKEYGWTDEELNEQIEDPIQLSGPTLEKLSFVDDDGTKRTFKEQMEREIAEGGEFPRVFASTEY